MSAWLASEDLKRHWPGTVLDPGQLL